MRPLTPWGTWAEWPTTSVAPASSSAAAARRRGPPAAPACSVPSGRHDHDLARPRAARLAQPRREPPSGGRQTRSPAGPALRRTDGVIGDGNDLDPPTARQARGRAGRGPSGPAPTLRLRPSAGARACRAVHPGRSPARDCSRASRTSPQAPRAARPPPAARGRRRLARLVNPLAAIRDAALEVQHERVGLARDRASADPATARADSGAAARRRRARASCRPRARA